MLFLKGQQSKYMETEFYDWIKQSHGTPYLLFIEISVWSIDGEFAYIKSDFIHF